MELLYGALFVVLVAAATLLIWIYHNRVTTAPDEQALDKLAGVGQAILSAQLTLEALCEIVYDQATGIIDTSNFQLGLFQGSDYAIQVWIRNGERQESQVFSEATASGLIGWVKRTGQELLVGDYETEWDRLPAKPSYQAQFPSRSALFAPLVASGETIGVIAVQSDQPHAFTTGDLHRLRVLTNQAAGVIRNVQLLEQAQNRNRQLQLVNEVSRQISAVQPLPALFDQIVTLIHQMFGYYAVNIFILNEKQSLVTLRASSHPTFQENILELKVGQGLVGWAALNAQSSLVDDVTKDERFFYDGLLNETLAEVSVPLIVERRVVGVLDIQSDQAGAFTQDDLNVLETLAGQLALAIQEAETYEAERRQRERLNALTEASRAVVSILNIDDLLDEVVDLVTDYFGYDRTHIFLREDNKLVFRAGSGAHSGRWAIEQLAYDIDGEGIIAKATRMGQPIISGNVTENPDYTVGPGLEDTRSEMVIPIQMGRQTLGVLDIQSTDIEAFSSEDAALAEALSDTIAIALRNATLYAREKRRRIMAESLREVSTVLGASLEVENVLDGILQGLERVITLESAMIVLLNDEIEAFYISAVRGKIAAATLVNTIIALEADVQETIRAIFRMGTSDEGQHHEQLFIPLTLGEDLIGYLAVDHVNHHLSEGDLEIMNAFAMQSAMAIANAQLYMAQREEAWISTALLQVAEATARAGSLDEVLQTVARITPLLVGVEWCGVLMQERDRFRIVEVEGIDSTLSDRLVGTSIEVQSWPPLAEMLEYGQPVTLDQESLTLDSLEQSIAIEHGAMLPLYAKGEIVGALLIGQQHKDDLLSAKKIELVGGIANQAALAIESAQAYAAQQEEAWVTTALLQVAEAVNAQVQLASSLETVVRLTPLLVGVSRCAVLRWDSEEAVFRGAVAYGLLPEAEEELTLQTISPDQHPYFEALLSKNVPISAGKAEAYTIPPILFHLFQSTSVLGLPLSAQGKLVGVMLVNHPSPGQPIDQRRMNILTGIASQTALAIETSRLQAAFAERQRLEQELEVAKSIQSSFLPETTPTIPGWGVAAYYRAARMVGGDFYDFIELPDGTWGIVVADVADKGIPAALYMALSRALLRAVARNRQDPAETLLRVNKLLLEDTHSDLFVTMWYAIWNPAASTLRFSSAGHNPPIVVNSVSGDTQVLKLKGIALGVFEDITLRTQTIDLVTGDAVVMYTDGITEAHNFSSVEFGVKGLERATRAHCHESASMILDGIVEALDDHTGDEPQFDDLTLVVLRCDGDEAQRLATDANR